jgi:hypothetical protein
MDERSGGFFEFMPEKGKSHFMRLPLAYDFKRIRRISQDFFHLNVVFRNLKEFDSELTRAFIANATRANEYILPFDEATLFQEWKRTSSGVVNGMAMAALKKLSKFYSNFKEVYSSAVSHSCIESVRTDISIHPLTFAIYRSVNNFSEMNKRMGYTTDLSRQLETITLIDLDKLAERERTSNNMVFLYSTLGRKLAYQLATDHDLVIAKARTMQFGRALLDIKFAMEKDFRFLKEGTWY